MTTNCSHGFSPPPSSKVTSILEDVRILKKNALSASPSKKVERKALKRITKLHSRFITSDGKSKTLACMFAGCAQILAGNGARPGTDPLVEARSTALDTIDFQTYVWQDEPILCSELWNATEQVMTKQGLVRYVAKHLPCNCLDSIKVETKKEKGKTGFCAVCCKEYRISDMKQCSGCKVTPYCSQICQQKDWKTHQGLCSGYAEFKNENVASAPKLVLVCAHVLSSKSSSCN